MDQRHGNQPPQEDEAKRAAAAETVDTAGRDAWHAQELSRMYGHFVTEFENAARMLDIRGSALERRATEVRQDLEKQQIEGRENPFLSFNAAGCLEAKRDVDNLFQRLAVIIKELELFVVHIPDIWPKGSATDIKAQLDKALAAAKDGEAALKNVYSNIVIPENLESHIQGDQKTRSFVDTSGPTVLERHLTTLRKDMDRYLQAGQKVEGEKGLYAQSERNWSAKMVSDTEGLIAFLERLEKEKSQA